MDPRVARNRLSAYLDDELPPGERSAVKAALDQDDELRAELARLRAVRALLQEDPLFDTALVRRHTEALRRLIAAFDPEPTRPG